MECPLPVWHDNVGHEDDLDRFSPDYTADELKKRYKATGFGIQTCGTRLEKVITNSSTP
jgi:hypothetical protein